MKVKLDGFYLNVLINGLYSQHLRYDDETNIIIDTLLLRLVDESDKLKPNRKIKIYFEPVEVSAIKKSLIDWRNQQLQAEKKLPLRLSVNCLKNCYNAKKLLSETMAVLSFSGSIQEVIMFLE